MPTQEYAIPNIEPSDVNVRSGPYAPPPVEPPPKEEHKDQEIIGVKDAIMLWRTLSGTDNSDDDAGNSGLVVYVFNTTDRHDSAKIALENTGGQTEYVNSMILRAKPVVRSASNSGYVHDDFIDYEDIYKNGESVFELQNSYIINKSQIEELADFHWKNFRNKRHIYMLSMTGTRYWFSPGEWYTIQIGGAGEEEYIDSVCECYMVQTERGVGGLGSTTVAFREIYQNWVQDTSALARFISQGDPRNIYDAGRVVVAAYDYCGDADYFCDGSNDEIQINAAINDLSGVGGGTVYLTEGTFKAEDEIIGKDGIVIQLAAGCVVQQYYNGALFSFVGSSGSEYNRVGVQGPGTIQSIAGYISSSVAVKFSYCDDSFIRQLNIIPSGAYAISADNCDRLSITLNNIVGCSTYGIYVSSGGSGIISQNNIEGTGTLDADLSEAIQAGADFTISNNIIHDFNLTNQASLNSVIINTGGRGSKCINNTIHTITNPTNDIWGIFAQDLSNGDISGNTIYDLSATNAGSAKWCEGILLYNPITNGTDNNVKNNVIENCDATHTASQGNGIDLDTLNSKTLNNTLVSQNHITDCSGHGIVIDDSDVNKTSVIGNYCRNNGSDTDIANDNEHNFDDNGTATQYGLNSWQGVSA